MAVKCLVTDRAQQAVCQTNSWFQTFAVFWRLYYFFWVIPQCWNFIGRIFGTHCPILIGGVSRNNNSDERHFSLTCSGIHLGSLPSTACFSTWTCPIPVAPPRDWLRLFSNQTFSRVNTPIISSQLFFLLTPPMKMEQTECSEMPAYKIQMLGNYQQERIQYQTNVWPCGQYCRMSSPHLENLKVFVQERMTETSVTFQ